MKIIFVLFFCLLSWTCAAQTVYESDYVHEGKTFQYALYDKYILSGIFDEEESFKLYVLDTVGFSYFLNEYETDTIPFNEAITVGFIKKENNASLSNSLAEFDDFLGYFDEVEVKKEPVITKKSGFPFLTTRLKVIDEELVVETINLGALELGDYIFVFATINLLKENDGRINSLFDRIVSSIKIIETTKKNRIKDDEYYDLISKNNYLETVFIEGVFSFDKAISKYWQKWGRSFALFSFDYGPPDGQIEGSIYGLSAGINSANLSDEEVLNFVKNIEEKPEFTKAVFLETVVGADFKFKKYQIKDALSKDKMIVYTTESNGETLVILVDRTAHNVSAFPQYCDNFVKSMHYTASEE